MQKHPLSNKKAQKCLLFCLKKSKIDQKFKYFGRSHTFVKNFRCLIEEATNSFKRYTILYKSTPRSSFLYTGLSDQQ